MIDLYHGEFTISPIPLELSFNACSHGCFYCYANLNNPKRKINSLAVLQFLANLDEHKTVSADLLRAGYPVLLSNRCDPFASSNIRQAGPIIEALTGMGVPLAFQTKGYTAQDAGRFWAIVESLAPAVWYVTIECTEAARQIIAPGAPGIPDRLALVEALTGLGHKVVVAVNPCVPDWIGDPHPHMRQIQNAGALGVWIERLHISRAQAKNLSGPQLRGLGRDILKRAASKARPDEIAYIERTRQTALDLGLDVFSVGQANKSEFFKPYEELYPKLYPTVQGFINSLNGHGPDDVIAFDQYARFMCNRLPAGVLPIQSYLGATSPGLWARHDVPQDMTYRDLLRFTWIDPHTKYSLVHSRAFAYAGLWDAGSDNGSNPPGWVQLTDPDGDPYMVYNPYGFNDYYACLG